MAKKLITLKEALELLNDIHNFDSKKFGRDAFKPQTIYNAVFAERIKRYGPRHIAQFDREEIIRVFGPKKSA